MQFSTLLITSVFAAFAAAQNASTTTAPVSSSVALTPAQSSQASCLDACNPQDPSCRAGCIVVPDGDSAQNHTIECIGACPKGNGTSEDNANFENCQKSCIASATLTSSGPAATATGSTGGSATGGSATGGSATGGAKTTGTSGNTATGTNGAVASATSSKAAADNVRVGVSVAGVVGVFAAVFAL